MAVKTLVAGEDANPRIHRFHSLTTSASGVMLLAVVAFCVRTLCARRGVSVPERCELSRGPINAHPVRRMPGVAGPFIRQQSTLMQMNRAHIDVPRKGGSP